MLPQHAQCEVEGHSRRVFSFTLPGRARYPCIYLLRPSVLPLVLRRYVLATLLLTPIANPVHFPVLLPVVLSMIGTDYPISIYQVVYADNNVC